MQQHFDDGIAHQARSIAASSCIVSVASLLALSRHPTARQRTRPSVILDCPVPVRQDTGLAIKDCSTLAQQTLLQFVRCESHHGNNHRYVSVCTRASRLLFGRPVVVITMVGCRRRRASQACLVAACWQPPSLAISSTTQASNNHDNHLGASSGRLPEAVANDSIATPLSVGEIDSGCFVRTQPRVAIAAKTQGLSIPSCVGNQPPTPIKGWLANQPQRLLGNSNTL